MFHLKLHHISFPRLNLQCFVLKLLKKYAFHHQTSSCINHQSWCTKLQLTKRPMTYSSVRHFARGVRSVDSKASSDLITSRQDQSLNPISREDQIDTDSDSDSDDEEDVIDKSISVTKSQETQISHESLSKSNDVCYLNLYCKLKILLTIAKH